ncbi:MAG: hypothetical protein OEL75_03075 [Kiritimatiellaceae bacterium]|nr:hypothetical protein [Kiritimatiellaceae bacterium]
MQSLFTTYPAVYWKQGWALTSGLEDKNPLITTSHLGALSAPDSSWTLSLLPASIPSHVRLFSNCLSIHARKQRSGKYLAVILTEPGVLTGESKNLSLPTLSSELEISEESGLFQLNNGAQSALLLHKGDRFALVWGDMPKELARVKAEEVLDENFEELIQEETEARQRTARLFSINLRHNPPVALAAESLRNRLRSRTATLHGLWSVSDGFEHETFSLNELYPLLRAWVLVDPDTAVLLMETALKLQNNTGGFPAWINEQGIVSRAAPWPMMIQCFELVWQENRDPALLKKMLPALRKYMQWALRHFDPHRDQIHTWQSEQEVFIPNDFERNKATPDLTVMLINEIEALLRLCEDVTTATAATDPLTEELDQLVYTLTTTFWNPETKSFSNIWKEGHILHEPSIGSFLPLLWNQLPKQYKSPLLDQFEETHGCFPGREDDSTRKRNEVDDTNHLPAIHQFMAFDALRCADTSRSLLMMFVHRAREGFLNWFERESIGAARELNHNNTVHHQAYSLGPVMASLVLTTQHEFEHEVSNQSSFIKRVQHWAQRHQVHKSDIRITVTVCIALLAIHLAYHAPKDKNAETRMAEAAINYSQGRLSESLQICRQHPEHPLSSFILANMMMLTGNTEQAEELYHKALLKESGSPSALLGYALSLQTNGKFDQAIRRYNDFIDIHEHFVDHALIQTAYKFLHLAEEKFTHPPKWKHLYKHTLMNDLGL